MKFIVTSHSSGASGIRFLHVKGSDCHTAVKEMLESIKGLVDELKVTVAESKRSGTMHNIEQTTRELSDTYRTVKRDIER